MRFFLGVCGLPLALGRERTHLIEREPAFPSLLGLLTGIDIRPDLAFIDLPRSKSNRENQLHDLDNARVISKSSHLPHPAPLRHKVRTSTDSSSLESVIPCHAAYAWERIKH